jgi:enoyl-CoA hydratase/carnithine racemase
MAAAAHLPLDDGRWWRHYRVCNRLLAASLHVVAAVDGQSMGGMRVDHDDRHLVHTDVL